MRPLVCPTLLLTVACAKPAATAPHPAIPPATVQAPVGDQQTPSITLTAAAAQRLAIRLVRVEERSTSRRRTVGGTAAIPAGRLIRLVAPLAALLQSANAAWPTAGATVAADEALFTLQPLQPESVAQRAAAQRDVAAAHAAFDAADARHRRAQQMLTDKTGSARAVEEAAALKATATADLAAASARVDAWAGPMFDKDGRLALMSPFAGVIWTCDVAPYQIVAAGTVLCEVAALDRLWVRVAVHVGDLSDVDRDSPARVGLLSDAAVWSEARVASAPPAADAVTASVDLVYELANPGLQLRPGERLLVSIPLRGQTVHRVVPRAAVLFDLHGDSWVYVHLEPNKFARQRVQIEWVEGTDAVLAAGPASGTEVVTLGAAELFGTEFGTGK